MSPGYGGAESAEAALRSQARGITGEEIGQFAGEFIAAQAWILCGVIGAGWDGRGAEVRHWRHRQSETTQDLRSCGEERT